MNCQACTAFNPDGVRICINCNALLPASAAPDAPRCATHPDAVAAGPCGRCGTFACGKCLKPGGNQWLCEACFTRVSLLPWDERETLGTWRAWWRTCTRMISAPQATMQSAPAEGSLGSSLLYALLCSVVGYGPTFLVYALIFGVTAAATGDKSGAFGDSGVPAVAMAGIFVGYAVVLTLGQAAAVFLTAALDHLGLVVLRANPKSYAVTVRANALALSPSLIGLLPLCSLYVFPLWSLVLRGVALSTLHQVPGWKAAVAILWPVFICGGGGIALAVLVPVLTAR